MESVVHRSNCYNIGSKTFQNKGKPNSTNQTWALIITLYHNIICACVRHLMRECLCVSACCIICPSNNFKKSYIFFEFGFSLELLRPKNLFWFFFSASCCCYSSKCLRPIWNGFVCDCVSPVCLSILYYTYYTPHITYNTCITIMAHYRYYSRVFYLSIIISLPFVFCCSTRKTSIIWFRCHRVYEDMSLYHIVILLWRHFFLVCALYLNFLVDFIIFFFPKENDESAMLEIELYFSFSFWRVRHVNKKMIINTEKMKKKMKYTSRLNRILLIFLY